MGASFFLDLPLVKTPAMRLPISRKPFLTLANQTCVVFSVVPCLSPDVPIGRASLITLPSGTTVVVC